MILTKKLTKKAYYEYLKLHKSNKKTLIVFREIPFKQYFKNSICVHSRKEKDVDYVIKEYEKYYKLPFKNNSFEIIVCFGVLEHVKNQEKLIKELKRILKKDGKLIISCASVMSVHDAPNHYTNLTEFGMKKLLNEWKIKDLRGNSDSATTIGILLQRLSFQTDSNIIFKAFLLTLAKIFPYFRIFIRNEYGDISRKYKLNSCMPAYIFATAMKK